MSSDLPNEKPMPHAGRPRGDAWRALVAEGIEWEGQVLLGSLEQPLSARLIVTSQRLAFARGGEVVLDIARWWLKRPPFMSGDGGINLRIETGSGQRERLAFHARDGRATASDIVTLLTHGKQALPSPQLDPIYTDVPRRRAPRYEEEFTREEPDKPARPMKRAIEDDDYVYSNDVIDATTLQVLDVTDFPPVTETQTPSTQRGTTSTGALGDPITISTLGNQTHRSGEWSLAPMTSMPSGRSSKAGWAFRLSGLVLLLVVAAAIGTSGLPDTGDIRDRGNAILAPLTGDETEPAGNLAQVVPTATEPNRSVDATRSAQETSIALGVGGETVAVPTNTATTEVSTATLEPTATDEPTETPEPTETDEPTATATEEPTETEVDETEPTIGAAADDTATEMPTATATDTETATATETETLAPTETGTAIPTETETAVPTETATSAPPTETATIEEPTQAPTEDPGIDPTASPTETGTDTPEPSPTDGPTDTATSEPTGTETSEPTATETPEPTPTAGFPLQQRTIGQGELPDQVFSTGAFRYTVEYAERAAEIPTLELPPVATGEWVVVVLHATNWTSETATLNMADFQLLVFGDFGYQFVGMDASSPDIGRFLGFDPVLEIAELRAIPAGEGMRLALVYLVPPTTSDIELVDDTSGLNLGQALAAGGDVTALGSAPKEPELLEAVVTEVIDGRTIVVEAEGFTATIQYLGVVVPTADQCYAAEATETNSNIVLGQTVYLEREYRNRVIADGEALARDVWIDNGQGGLVLVSAWLASEGAAEPAPVDEDIRFAGWIQAAADSAEGNLVGFWAACGAPPVVPDGIGGPNVQMLPLAEVYGRY